MIITKIYGGLGNQLFQYSTGLAIARRLKTSLYLDESWFTQNKYSTKRSYELASFKINNYTPVNFFELLFIKYATNRFSKFFPRFILKTFKEQQYQYDNRILNVSDNSVIDGYWQSYKYFDSIHDEIIDILDLKAFDNSDYYKQISNTDNSVSVHIRRTDYLTSPIHEILTSQYYENAEKEISKHIKSPTFFVFSDDPEYVKVNVKFNNKTVFINTNNALEDLYLMSICKNNIIANSTFSWWAAYLNKTQNKLVIAPSTWFKNGNMDSTDLCPNEWIKI